MKNQLTCKIATAFLLAVGAMGGLCADSDSAPTYEKGRKIRLLFAFDSNAVDYLQSENKDYMSFAAQGVVQMNQVLKNSLLDEYFTYELAGVTIVPSKVTNLYTAYANVGRELNGGGHDDWEGLTEERYATSADVVVALIYTGTAGGTTGTSHPYTGTTVEYAKNYAGYAYSCCSVQTAELEITGILGQFQVLSHEVAHTLGCGHSDESDTQPNQQSSGYSFGYQFKYHGGKNYTLYNGGGLNAWYGATVMAYKEHFFRNEDGSFMSREDVLAKTGWTDADEETKFWDNTNGDYSGYGHGVFNYCNQLPYFSSPDLCFVDMGNGTVTVKTLEWIRQYQHLWPEGTYTPMGDEKHNNRQVLLDNYQYASRWHLGVKFSKDGNDSVVNGKSDKITLSPLSKNLTIYYTTDGTEPTKENGTLYTRPFSLVSAATVKARAYDSSGNAGDVLTKQYSMNPLGVALGNTELTWTTDSHPWFATDDGAKSGNVGADNGTSTLSTTITGEGKISFEYQLLQAWGDTLTVKVDGETAVTFDTHLTNWTAAEFTLKDDVEHIIEWTITTPYWFGDESYAKLRAVTVDVTHDERPDEPDDPVVPCVVPGTISVETMTQQNVVLDETEEWAVIGDTPIFFTVPSQTNVFTVAFDADVPEGAGTIFGFSLATANLSSSAEVRARRDAQGVVFGAHNGTEKFTSGNYGGTGGGTTVVSSGRHKVTVSYDHRNATTPYDRRGVTISVDGTNIYHCASLSYAGRIVPLFSIGGAAVETTPTDVLTGLKVKNLTFLDGLMSEAEYADEGVDALTARQTAIYLTQLRDTGTRVRLNGSPASAADSARLIDYFGLASPETNVVFRITGFDVSSLALALEPRLRNGRLVLEGSRDLAEWSALETSEDNGRIPAPRGYGFFRLAVRD